MSESVILCEGYHDRAFWAGWLVHLGCTDPGERPDGGRRGRVTDPWGATVSDGQFAYRSQSGHFVRVIPCHGKSNILRAAESRLKDRIDKQLRHLVLCFDSDADASATATGDQGGILPAMKALVARHDKCQANRNGDYIFEDSTVVTAPVCWTVDDPRTDGLPAQQTLERLVCAALVAVYPDRGPVIQRWLDSRPKAPIAGPKEFAWSHMAGWYAKFGCETFYRQVWDDNKAADELRHRLDRCGAWRIGELLAK
jgi:hypothetical protein